MRDGWRYFLELYTLPSSSITFAGDETTLTTGLVLSGAIVVDNPFLVLGDKFCGSVELAVCAVKPWVVGEWEEFNTAGLLEVLVTFFSAIWLPTPLFDVRLDALLDNTDELLPKKNN